MAARMLGTGTSKQSLLLGSLFVAGTAHILIKLIIKQRRDANKHKYPPVPNSSMWDTISALAGDDFPWFLLEAAEALKARTFQLSLPLPVPMVVAVGDPKLAREILSDKGTTKPIHMYQNFDATTNGLPTIFTSNGNYWHERRKGVAPAFAASQVHRMNQVALKTADQWIVNKMKEFGNGFSFDVGKEMIDLLLQSLSITAFEYTLSRKELEAFKHELELAMKEFLFKSATNAFRKLYGLFLQERRRAHLASQYLHELCLTIVQSYRALEHPTEGTIIDLIMNNPCYQSDAERAADIFVFLNAGHDTTAYSLAWTLKELALNPQLQTELRQELALEDPSTVHNNSFLKKCIREAIRLHPVSSVGSVRELGRDFVTIDGKLIPSGSIAFLPFILQHRDPNVFGETANQYDPQRWDDPTPEMMEAFLPFSAGKQNCVGQSLANAEMHSIVPQILAKFELSVEQPGTTAYFFTLKPVDTILKATLLKDCS